MKWIRFRRIRLPRDKVRRCEARFSCRLWYLEGSTFSRFVFSLCCVCLLWRFLPKKTHTHTRPCNYIICGCTPKLGPPRLGPRRLQTILRLRCSFASKPSQRPSTRSRPLVTPMELGELMLTPETPFGSSIFTPLVRIPPDRIPIRERNHSAKRSGTVLPPGNPPEVALSNLTSQRVRTPSGRLLGVSHQWAPRNIGSVRVSSVVCLATDPRAIQSATPFEV